MVDIIKSKDSLEFLPDVAPATPLDINGGDRESLKLRDLTIPDDSILTGGSGSGSSPGSSPDSSPVVPDSSSSPVIDSSNTDLWQPDPNVSPDENLASLYGWLRSLLNPSLRDSYSFTSQPRVFADLLASSFDVIRKYFNGEARPFLDKSAMITLAEKMADIYNHFIDAEFSAALSYQSWYLQQEYNSPINQINRLAEAGLSSAFVVGNLNAGNAQSAAGMPQLDQVQASGAGQVQQQADAARKSLFGSIFGTVFGGIGDLLSAGGGFFKDVAEGETVRKLRPLQIAELGSRIAGNASTLMMQQTEVDQMKQNMAMKAMDTELSFGSQELEAAAQSVDRAQQAYQTDFNNYSQEIEDQEWQTHVIDKYGNRKIYNLSTEDLKDVIKNHGKTKDGYYVEGYKSWQKALTASGSSNLGIDVPLVGKAGAQGGISGTDTDAGGNKDSQSNESERGWSTDHSSGKSSVGYSEDGSEFHIGESSFKSVTTRRRVPLPEYKARIESKLKLYQDALDHFNTLSKGQQTRCLRMLDELQRNLSYFSSGVLKATYSDRINQLFQPKQMVAD